MNLNYLVISVLFFIVFILMYLLYKYFMNTTLNAPSLLYLLNSNIPITGLTIKIPNTVHYTYSTWVYVNTWNTNNMDASLFQVMDTTNQSNPPLIQLFLASNTLTLSCKILTTSSTTPPVKIDITNNFPVQKWVYVIISVDGSVVDMYLDGKLVVSKMLTSSDNKPVNCAVSNTPQINFGTGYDIYLSKFQRWTYATDPQTAWNTYYNGNGQTMRGLSGYGANLGITQNNILQQEIKLF